jgi:hypothetical protein
MKLRVRTRLTLIIAALLCVSTTTAFAQFLRLTSSWSQKKVSSRKFAIHSACMMPPQGRLTRIGMAGSEGMTKESEAWAATLETLVESQLKSDGLAITSSTDPISSGASSADIGNVIAQVKEKLNSVSTLMFKKAGQISKSAYTLGDQVGMLPCSEKSDILVFVQGVGQVLTENRAAVTFLAGGPAQDAVVFITMADAKTGEILGLIKMYPGDGFPENTDQAFGMQLARELSVMNIGSARKYYSDHQP